MNLPSFLHWLVNPRIRLQGLGANLPQGPEEENGERPLGSRRAQVFNPPLVLGSLILVALIVVMIVGPLLSTHDHYITVRSLVPHYDKESGRLIKPPFEPSAEYPLGSDNWGNDLFSLLVYGARVTLIAAATITLARMVLGTLLGALAGWNTGGLLDRGIQLVAGVITSIPLLLSSMILILALDIKKGLVVFLVALTVVGWTEISEHVRSQTMIIREMAYIEGARAAGLTPLQIVVRHALPNLLPHLVVIAFLDMGSVLLLMAELGFLGVFIGGGSTFSLDSIFGEASQLVEVPEWGAILAQGTPSLRTYPHMILAPSLAFFTAIIGLNSFGEGLRRLLDNFSVNTAILLRKRTGVAAVALVLLIAIVFELTGPKLSYRKVANTFEGTQADRYAGELQQIAHTGASLQAEYIAAQFKELGLQRGLRFSINTTYQDMLETRYVVPAETPGLALVAENGEPETSFTFDEDFTYLLRGPAGEGIVQAPVSVIRLQRLSPTAVGYALNRILRGVEVQSRILIIDEEVLANAILDGFIRVGAAGLLLVTEEASPLDPPQLITELADGDAKEQTPVYRIHPSVAEAILGQAGMGLDALGQPEQELIEVVKTDVEVQMKLELKTQSAKRYPIVVGFLPGYDMEIDKELVIVASSFDGTETDQQNSEDSTVLSSGTAAMLEVARSWSAARVDPRRSVLFIAWGSGTLQDPGFEEYITNPLNFTRLPVSSNQIGEPEMLFGLEESSSSGDIAVIEPDVDEKLKDLFVASARMSGLRVSQEQVLEEVSEPEDTAARLQSILIQVPQDGQSNTPVETMSAFGRALSYALLQVVRQENY